MRINNHAPLLLLLLQFCYIDIRGAKTIERIYIVDCGLETAWHAPRTLEPRYTASTMRFASTIHVLIILL